MEAVGGEKGTGRLKENAQPAARQGRRVTMSHGVLNAYRRYDTTSYSPCSPQSSCPYLSIVHEVVVVLHRKEFDVSIGKCLLHLPIVRHVTVD